MNGQIDIRDGKFCAMKKKKKIMPICTQINLQFLKLFPRENKKELRKCRSLFMIVTNYFSIVGFKSNKATNMLRRRKILSYKKGGTCQIKPEEKKNTASEF